MVKDDDAVMTFSFEKFNALSGALESLIFFLFHVTQFANSDKICILQQERESVNVPFALYLALLIIRTNDSNFRLAHRCLLGHIVCMDPSSKHLFGSDRNILARLC
jgi:hypothetical protein